MFLTARQGNKKLINSTEVFIMKRQNQQSANFQLTKSPLCLFRITFYSKDFCLWWFFSRHPHLLAFYCVHTEVEHRQRKVLKVELTKSQVLLENYTAWYLCWHYFSNVGGKRCWFSQEAGPKAWWLPDTWKSGWHLFLLFICHLDCLLCFLVCEYFGSFT